MQKELILVVALSTQRDCNLIERPTIVMIIRNMLSIPTRSY